MHDAALPLPLSLALYVAYHAFFLRAMSPGMLFGTVSGWYQLLGMITAPEK